MCLHPRWPIACTFSKQAQLPVTDTTRHVRPEELDAQELETLLQLRQSHPEVDRTYDLVQQFAQMLRTCTGERLDAWLTEVSESQISELQGFALGIERDKAAVFAGLTLPHSNGIVEGKVNQLKLIKRMGLGRTGFPLLY